MQKRIFGYLAINILCIALSYLLRDVQLIKHIENRTWDWRVSLSANPADANQNIKLIVVDQKSLDAIEKEWGNTWPFPRSYYVPVVKFLESAQARGLAFDLLFTESSVHAAEEDQLLAEAFAGKLAVISAVAPDGSNKAIDQAKFTIFKQRQEELDAQYKFAQKYLSAANIKQFSYVALPVEEMIKPSASLGSVAAEPDSDGIFRHYRVGAFVQGVPLLGLAFAFYERVMQGAFDLSAVDQFGNVSIKFHGREQTYPTYSIYDVINSWSLIEEGRAPTIDPSLFKDAWVILGVWAPGLMDIRPSPLDEKFKGVELHAAMLDNLLSGQFVRKISDIYALVYAIVFALLCSACIIFVQDSRQLVYGLAASLALFILCAYFSALADYWLPFVFPAIALALSIPSSLIFQYELEGRQRRFIKTAFRQYVSPAVIEKIIANPNQLSLGGERRELSIFFSDLEKFTSLSENLEASKLAELLNLYLSEMTQVILEFGGTVDKYVGDAIVAFWNAPLSQANHAQLGVEAGLRCLQKLEQMQSDLQDNFSVNLKMRIGINTGIVSVGNFGSVERFDYTVIGDAANLASRLEGVNKVFGSYILISESCYQALGNKIKARKVAEILVMGKSQAVTVYEPSLDSRFGLGDKADVYFQGLNHFENANLIDALQCFNQLPYDKISQAYVKRIEKEMLGFKNTEWKKEWSKVWRMSEK